MLCLLCIHFPFFFSIHPNFSPVFLEELPFPHSQVWGVKLLSHRLLQGALHPGLANLSMAFPWPW